MRKFLLFVLVLFCVHVNAQSPQGISYQGVATNNSGQDLPNQNISLRFSIEDQSLVTTYSETHSVTTDGFGLFTVVIGEGTYQSGVVQMFSDLNWGNNQYWLRVEMDETGGTNYQLMGSRQMMSVPYALYAETSNNPGPQGPAGADGLGISQININSLGDLIVTYTDGNTSNVGNVLGPQGIIGPQGVPGNTGAAGQDGVDGQPGIDGLGITSVLVDSNGDLILTFTDGSTQNAGYIVGPIGPPGSDGIDGVQGLQGPAGADAVIDSSYIDSVVAASILNNTVVIKDIIFPDGYDNMEIIQHNFNDSNFVVPSGKNLYIMQSYASSGSYLKVNGETCLYTEIYTPTNMGLPIILKEGDVVSMAGPSYALMYGYLVDSKVDPFQHNFSSSVSYTVPVGKNLYIMQSYSNSGTYLEVNGTRCMYTDYNTSNNMDLPIILKEGDVVSMSSQNALIYGYLVDSNYFNY